VTNILRGQLSKKRNRYLIPIVIILGLMTLFFFPSPEENFLAYMGTALFFVIVVLFLSVWRRRKR